MRTTTEEMENQLLRTRIEAAVGLHSIVLVTSATAGDGKSACAFGLAAAFADAGYTTALVDLDHENPELEGVRSPDSLATLGRDGLARYLVRDASTGVHYISFATSVLDLHSSRQEVSSTAESLRERFDMTVIDAGCVARSGISSLFAKTANGVIATVKRGRRLSKADSETARLLDGPGINFLGVVPIAASRVDEFTNRDRERVVDIGRASLPASRETVRAQRVAGI